MKRSVSLVVGLLAIGATACGRTTAPDTVVDPAGGTCLEGSLDCDDNPLIIDPTSDACLPGTLDCNDAGVPQDSLANNDPPATDPPVDEYGPATVDLPITDSRTQPITDELADGVYFSQAYEPSGDGVAFTLTQYFQCDDNVPDEPKVLCASGFGTLDAPSSVVDLASDAVITIATGDLESPTRADVSVAEFVHLVGGGAAAASAPDDFVFTPHFVFVEVRHGEVVAVEQFYTS